MKKKLFRLVWIDEDGINYGQANSFECVTKTCNDMKRIFPFIEFNIEPVIIEDLDKQIRLLETIYQNTIC